MELKEDFVKSKKILSELYNYFFDNASMFEKKLSELQMNGGNHDNQPRERLVCDFIASMTDRYAMNLYRKIFFPSTLV